KTCFNSAELTEDQLLLLLESLQVKIVPQQLKLVREHTSHSTQNEGGGGGLLSFSGEKEQELTIAMVGMSGVTLQKDGSVVCKKDAISATEALYVSLYVLSVLSK
ncbi:GSDA3 protein, partial [Pedionomus torquatus]|nr:GSDA3 protein [Pedionomus torquatus]